MVFKITIHSVFLRCLPRMDSTCLGPGSILFCILLVTAMITTSCAGSPLGRCESNYTLLPSGCYYDTGQNVNKDAGVQLCNKTNGHIFVVETDQEQTSVISSFGITESWITLGIHKVTTYNKIRDGKLITWSAWRSGEPNGELEKCAAIVTTTEKWVDVFCHVIGRVICEKNEGNCGIPYTKLSTGCYLDTRKAANKDGAVLLCENFGHILVVESEQEQKEVISQFRITDRYTWLGLIQKFTFMKMHDGKPITFMQWQNGEPYDDAEKCGAIASDSKKWNDVPCSLEGRIICEMETALTSVASSCKICDPTAPQGDIIKLLDGNDSTCVKAKVNELPINLVFGMVNNKNLTSVNVSVVAKTCSEQRLGVAAKGSCDSKPLRECRLIADTRKNDWRTCKFNCSCGGTCACVLARAQGVGLFNQKVCEINVNI